MNKFAVQVLLILLLSQPSQAVQDTLISYHIESQRITSYPLALIDSSRSADHTDWSMGNNHDVVELSLIPPDTTFDGWGFTPLVPAQDLFSVNSYPVRTAIQLSREINDTLSAQCSGILVSSQYVLTDCHCVGRYIHLEDSLSDLQFFDELWAFPAYDNGSPNPLYPGVKAIEYITFKSNISPHLGKDIALIKLEEPVGDNVGWVGIAYDINDDFFLTNVFHEFSYPDTYGGADENGVYHADTLFYNYGEINDITDPWIGYSGVGISGQSGSSLLYTDNEEYYSYGTFVWSGTWHLRITPEIFYSFEKVLNADPSGTETDFQVLTGFTLSDAYPNPFNSSTHLRYSLPTDGNIEIGLYDLLGKKLEVVIKEFKSAGEYGVDLHLSNFESGVYICQIQSGGFSDSKKLLLLK